MTTTNSPPTETVHEVTLHAFRVLSLHDYERESITKQLTALVNRHLRGRRKFADLRLQVRTIRPDGDVELWVQPALAFSNEPSEKTIRKARERLNKKIWQATLLWPPVDPDEFQAAYDAAEQRRQARDGDVADQ